MKLYRGLKSSEFKHFTPEASEVLRKTWTAILKNRARGDFAFPKTRDSEITRAESLIKLQRQYFTDRREVALTYAKEHRGVLITLDVPQKAILDVFKLEFQNYGKRKSSFEIVYVIDAEVLHKNRKKWKLKVENLFYRLYCWRSSRHMNFSRL